MLTKHSINFNNILQLCVGLRRKCQRKEFKWSSATCVRCVLGPRNKILKKKGYCISGKVPKQKTSCKKKYLSTATVSPLECFTKAFVKDTWYLNKLLLYYSNNSTEITASNTTLCLFFCIEIYLAKVDNWD